MYFFKLLGLLPLLSSIATLLVRGADIVLSNDDGWAVAQIRAQFDTMVTQGHRVILSSPALNQSGKGSQTTTPTPLTEPCQYDSCPAGSPAHGFNASDPRLNYVNAYPVDAALYGIRTLTPRLWGTTRPDIVVTGPNIGLNIGVLVFYSGTVGAACAAALEGIPAVAFSGLGTEHEAWTALTDSPTSPSVRAARANAAFTTRVISALLPSLFPHGVILNVNFPPPTDGCTPDGMQFVLARTLYTNVPSDVEICDNGGRLPLDLTVLRTDGCYASVSVLDAATKLDAPALTQEAVLILLGELPFVCLPV